MKSFTYVILSLTILMLCQCKSRIEEKSAIQKYSETQSSDISISGATAVYPIMKMWADEFVKNHPDIHIRVTGNDTQTGIHDLIAGKSDIAMVSRKLNDDENKSEFWKATVSREGILIIVNEKNPFLDSLMKCGVSKATLAKLFSKSNLPTWGDVTRCGKKNKINLYKRAESSGATDIWAAYLGINSNDLGGALMATDSSIVQAVIKDRFALSYCNAHYAYDMQNSGQLKGLVVLPIDIDNNGRIDKKEMFYDKITDVQRAAYLGVYPHVLCRELTILCNGKPQGPSTVKFITWILSEGQKVAVNNGYSEIRHSEANEIIADL